MADRFYCPGVVADGPAWLEGPEAHHLARVRRLGVGAVVELFDGRGHAYPAEVRGVGRDRVELAVVGPLLPDRAWPCEVTLATAAPKGDRLDWLVEKATELGVARLVLLATERSVVEPGAGKRERLARRVIEAAKQCGRNRLMELEPIAAFEAFLRDEAAPVRVIAHPGGLPAPAWPSLRAGDRASLAIGPEGGFSPAEVASARAVGWQPVGLGSTVLRIETAGLAGVVTLLARSGGPQP